MVVAKLWALITNANQLANKWAKKVLNRNNRVKARYINLEILLHVKASRIP